MKDTYDIYTLDSDVEPISLDILICGRSNFVPFSTADGTDNYYVAAFNKNVMQHYILHHPPTFVHFLEACGFGQAT